jgi:hypothetical protein
MKRFFRGRFYHRRRRGGDETRTSGDVETVGGLSSFAPPHWEKSVRDGELRRISRGWARRSRIRQFPHAIFSFRTRKTT